MICPGLARLRVRKDQLPECIPLSVKRCLEPCGVRVRDDMPEGGVGFGRLGRVHRGSLGVAGIQRRGRTEYGVWMGVGARRTEIGAGEIFV